MPPSVLSEKNIVCVLSNYEVENKKQFETIDDAVACVVGTTPWRLHSRLEQFGIDTTLRRAWGRRNAKRRCRRGHIEKGRTLAWDAWQLVVQQATPWQVLLLSMTCKNMRDNIWGDHMLWRKLFIQWATPNEIVHRIHAQLNEFAYRPTVHALGWDAGEIQDKPRFNAAARKLVALRNTPCCGMCGQTRRKTDEVWALHMRLCSNCWRGNLISHYALRERYGIHLVAGLDDGDDTPFIARCFGKVYFFVNNAMSSMRSRFTYAQCDQGPATSRKVIFFWVPHLRLWFDLDGLYRRKQEKQHAKIVLQAVARRRVVAQIIIRAFESRVANGFAGMGIAAKTAVLHNLHTSLAKRGWRHDNIDTLYEPLMDAYKYQGLWGSAKMHQALGARTLTYA